MSRRKQQNPKPVKYDFPTKKEDEEKSEQTCVSPVVSEEDDTQSIPRKSPEHDDQTSEASLVVEETLESILGVPDDAPLRVEKCDETEGYRILSSTNIDEGAGLDPLRATRLDQSDVEDTESDSIVSFKYLEERVYFRLESKVHCSWLKYIGSPAKDTEANLRIYYVGGQLWVEVIKNLPAGEQLIAEFCDPSQKTAHATGSQPEPITSSTDPTDEEKSSVKTEVTNTSTAPDAPYACSLCGIRFRSPRTLLAHQKHYCSKLDQSNQEQRSPPPLLSSGVESNKVEQLQSAFLCLVCKYMTLKQADIEKHIQDHKSSRGRDAAGTSDITFCTDCEIHFKRPESYQAHKLHYCKNRKDSASSPPEPKRTPPSSPPAQAMYKQVRIVDNTLLGLGESGLPNILTIPAVAALPVLPAVKFMHPPGMPTAHMESKASTPVATSAPLRSATETPLDLSVKTTPDLKRKSDSPLSNSPPSKRSNSAPTSPNLPRVSAGPNVVRAKMQAVKPDIHIYRCENCGIPFYKQKVYEAHRMHYCTGRSNSGSDRSESPKQANEMSPQPADETTDDRLVITYTCNKCSTSYRTIETFKAHQCTMMKVTTTPALPTPQHVLRCHECDFSTFAKEVLLEHMDTHRITITFKCNLCGYHGNTMRGMRQHGRQHAEKGEEFSDANVVQMEQPVRPRISPALPQPFPITGNHDIDEELLRMKNEPYKKRRSRKHYQRAEHRFPHGDVDVNMSPKKENGMVPPGLTSPHSSDSLSPLQNSSAVNQDDSNPSSSPQVTVKDEPVDIIVEPTSPSPPTGTMPVPDKIKKFICNCNASFTYLATYEAHKKHYCPKINASATVTASQ